MCGRYSLTKKEMRIISKLPPHELQIWFRERFNIAPTEEVPVIYLRDGRLEVREMSWGLRPGWSKRPVINAQAEGLQQKPTFREAFLERRCLLPADGFYEWRKPDKAQFWFRRPDGEAFCFAGLWEGAPPRCVILTTVAGPTVQPVHHRMPVILAAAQYDDWLAEPGKAVEILQTHPGVELNAEIVSRDPQGDLFAS